MKRHLRTQAIKIVRLVLASLAVIGAGLAAEAEPTPLPTPTAAGPAAIAKDPEAHSNEQPEDEAAISLDASDLPEPLLCEFSWQKKEKAKDFSWINSGSDYPRIVPPVTKRELLSRPFTRSKSDRGPSWGTCAEIDESSESTELTVTLFAHASRAKTVPDGDTGRCLWEAAGTVLRGSARAKVRVGEWAGIEFETVSGEKKRFSVHWPEQTQSETDGAFCRKFASELMNAKPMQGRRFQKLKLR